MQDDAKNAPAATTAPRITLDAARVLGGLADQHSQTAVGGKPTGNKPEAAGRD
jgi:hypothetical protein